MLCTLQYRSKVYNGPSPTQIQEIIQQQQQQSLAVFLTSHFYFIV